MAKKRQCSDTENPPEKKKQRIFDFLAYPKRKIAIQFFYLGWKHDGLVQQPNTRNTVEHHLMEALLKTHLIEDWSKCEFSRCGRTDKGVSAFRQTAALTVRSCSPGEEGVFWDKNTSEEVKTQFKRRDAELPYIKILNGVLPKSIRVFGWSPVPTEFNARFNCNRRTYKYAFPKADLDLEKMRDAASRLVGEHDFSNFCQIDMNEQRLEQSYTRKIFAVDVKEIPTTSEDVNDEIYSMVELTVAGSGFLWHMIRFIVTVLCEVGRGNEEPSIVSEMLDLEKFPSRPQYTMASDTPLCLFDCGYDGIEWKTDDLVMRTTIMDLQKEWAQMKARTRMLENMLQDLSGMSSTSSEDMTKGLHEFVQDRPIPKTYQKFENRKKCESIQSKRQKLMAAKAAKMEE